MPQIGLGTWGMGESPKNTGAELRAIVPVLDAGVRLVDTAEMYGAGEAEEVLGRALRGRLSGLILSRRCTLMKPAARVSWRRARNR